MSEDLLQSRQRRGRRGQAKPVAKPDLAVRGGGLDLLDENAISRLHNAALQILSETGLAEAPDSVIELAVEAGATLSEEGRLCLPPALVEEVLASLPNTLKLYGRRSGLDLQLGAGQVHVGTGGASPEVLDLETQCYRPSTLDDVAQAARIVDAMPHIHFFSRPMVARNIDDPVAMEVNTAFACLSCTAKHVMVSASSVAAVDAIAELVYRIAGSREAFEAAPFLSLNVNHVVPPLRFDPDSAKVLVRAVECGIPVMVNTFGQLGASSPVTIAGCVAQTTAETLAGMVLVWLAAKQFGTKPAAIFGPRPMVTDLRTGAMSGGGGEQAKLTAAAIQMARHYGLPSSTIAGATDAKWPDAQSGYEKSLSITLALQAGADFITQAAGTQASLMGTALESYVIDNDMLGGILSAHSLIEVSDETLDPTAIHLAATEVGHFLGEPETLARMNSDFLYPEIGDRRTIGEWHEDGAPQIWQRAHDRVLAILAGPAAELIPIELVAELTAEFNLQEFSTSPPASHKDEVLDV